MHLSLLQVTSVSLGRSTKQRDKIFVAVGNTVSQSSTGSSVIDRVHALKDRFKDRMFK